MKNSVLITGVHGFCGRHLATRLIAEEMDVYGADIHLDPPTSLSLKDYFRMDIKDPSNVNDVIHSVVPDMIFHLAGLTVAEASEVYHVNFLGSVYLLEAIRKWVPQASVLMVGSAAEYGYVAEDEMPICETHPCNPITPYGISKHGMVLAAINFFKDYGVKIVIARPFNIIGAGIPPSLVIGAVLSRIKNALSEENEPAVISVGNIDTERDFIAVEDVVDAYLIMIRSNCWGEIFNVCSGKPFSIRSVLQLLADNSKRKIEFLENATLIRATDVKRVYGSAEKSAKMLGFKPKISLASALTAAWNEAVGGDS